MGMKFILTESQLAKLEESVGKVEVTEFGKANISCVYDNYGKLAYELQGREEKKIGYETWLTKDSYSKDIAIRHYRTNILTFTPDNIIIVNNGGHYSNTTKDRLNQFLRCRSVYISQKNFDWFVQTPYGTFEYRNGMEVLPDGQIFNQQDDEPKKYISRGDHQQQMKQLGIDPKYHELYGISKD